MNPLSIAERALGIARGVAETGWRAASGAVGAIRGSSEAEPQSEPEAAPPPPPKPELTDTALARKVESELFRDDAAPKDKVDVNAVGRVVYLRGEAKTPEIVNDLEARAQAIPEVERVENLLHLPKTPAPTRTDTPARQRKTRRTKGTAQPRKRQPAKPVNTERKTPQAEPTPKESAAKGEGRKPAPMGSRPKGRVNAEKQAPEAEPPPKESAAKGEGRKPAPMGSTDETT